VSLHPFLRLAEDRDVRHASAFRKVAADLSGEVLAAHWQEGLRAAPRRADAGRRFLQPHGGRPPSERQRSKDEENVAAALVRFAREGDRALPLPDESAVRFVDWNVPLRAAPADPALGASDPNRGVERVDLVGVVGDDRLALGFLKFLEPGAARAGTGDTPLRYLLEALGHAAIVQANREALAAEVEAAHGRGFGDAPPVVLLLASPRYWELCRRREAQKGAAWIHELERLARELETQSGVLVQFLALALEGDPGFGFDAEGARVDAPPRLERAWEAGAGRVRPKPKPRPRAAEPVPQVIEPHLTRPVRSYGPHESYQPGDRLQHPTLGLGVVQKALPGKVEVQFDGATSRLVAGRPL
jgi:hypothetical protein